MSELERKPKIRFKGFTEPWEQRELKALIDKGGSGGTPTSTNSEYYNGHIPFLSISDITNSNGFISDTEKHISEKGLSSSAAWIVPKEAISLAMYASVGKVAILKENIATSQAFYNMVIANKNNRDFLYHYLKKMEINNEWISLISTGTQANLNAEKVQKLLITISKNENEKSKIGEFLFNLDNLITLHQRKCDKLKTVKTALLKGMFPENEATTPKIRFKGFTEPWEQCEVGKIFKVTRGYVLPVSATSLQKSDNTPYPVYSSQTQNNGLMGYYKDYLFDTAITWTTDGANAGTVSFRGEKFYSTNVNGVLLSDKGYANKCVAEALDQLAWKHVSHVGNPKLMNNVMSEIVIIIPPTISEQDSISQLLTKLDDIIALHQRKLEKLKNIKKSLLERMFA